MHTAPIYAVGADAARRWPLCRGQADVSARRWFYPLPLSIIADLLGVPQEENWKLKNWSHDFAQLLGTAPVGLDRLRGIALGILQFRDYVTRLVQKHRDSPSEDLISILLTTTDRAESLTEDDVISNIVLLFSAGHETTANLIGNGVLALLQNPEQLQRLRDNPLLMSSAIEELLRDESPIQFTTRLVSERVEIGNKCIWQWCPLLPRNPASASTRSNCNRCLS
jgi:pimeloyl-[acyl-carrier protein] synthase